MGEFFGLIIRFFQALVPPNTNELGPQQRWRWMVFYAIILMAISQTLHVAIACGYVPHFSGFALDVTVQQLQARVDLTTQVVLERDMKDKEKDLCTTKDSSFKRELIDDIDNLQREYYKITGHYFKIRGCNEL